MRLIIPGGQAAPDSMKIFIHVLTGDEAAGSAVISAVREMRKGEFTVCTAEGPEDLFTGDPPAALSQMNLAVPVITGRYLDLAERTGFGIAVLAKASGLSVIPVLESADLIPRFNAVMGELHTVVAAGGAWRDEFEKQISRKLIGRELRQEIISGAFDGKMFLSYRKKDIADALKIMKAVHDTPAASAYEIWYDDFLTPGEDFNTGIAEAMNGSDIILLSVTPSLTERNSEGGENYVQAREYPAARDSGKPIIPVEARDTDRTEIERNGYGGIPEFVRPENGEELNERIRAAGTKRADPEKPSARAVYLLGMAFLMGIRVEKDTYRGIRLLDTAADMGSYDAAEELSRIHTPGIGIIPDQDRALLYIRKAFDIAEALPVSDPLRVRRMYRAVLGCWDGRFNIAKTHAEEIGYLDRIIKAAEERMMTADESESNELCLICAEAVLQTGNLENGPALPEKNDEENARYAVARLKEGKEYLDACTETPRGDIARLTVVYYSLYASACRTVGLYAKAIDCARAAMDHQERYVGRFDASYEARLLLASCTMNAGGCVFGYLLPHLKEHIADADDYLSPAVLLVRQAMDEYEQLYGERRQLFCGLEAAQGYRNLTLMNLNRKQNREYLERAKAFLDSVEKDYPGARDPQRIRAQLKKRWF